MTQQSNLAFEPLKQVTKFSKYLSLSLFVLLPFVGGYVGYKVGQTDILDKQNQITTAPQQTHTSTQSVEQNVPDTSTSNQTISIASIADMVPKGSDFELITSTPRLSNAYYTDGKISYDCMSDEFIAAIGENNHLKISADHYIQGGYSCTAYDFNDEYYLLTLREAIFNRWALFEKDTDSDLRYLSNPYIQTPEILDTGIFFDGPEGYLFTYDVITDTRSRLDIDVPIFLASCEMGCTFGKIYSSQSHPNTYFIEIRYINEYTNGDKSLPPDTYFYPLVLPSNN